MPAFGPAPGTWSALVNNWSRLVGQSPDDRVIPQIGTFTPDAAIAVTGTEIVTANGPLSPNSPSGPQPCETNPSLTIRGGLTGYLLPIPAPQNLTTQLFGSEHSDTDSAACVFNLRLAPE
jgi:hypothetical protein